MGIVTSTRSIEWPSMWRWVHPGPRFSALLQVHRDK